MIYGILSSGHRTASLLKASPKGEGFQPSPSETLILPRCPLDQREAQNLKEDQQNQRREVDPPFGGTSLRIGARAGSVNILAMRTTWTLGGR